MHFLILSVLVACASAQYYPGYFNYGYNTGYNTGYNYNTAFRTYNYNPYPYVPYSSSQYHSQDEFGQASYGYAYPGQAHTTTRDAFGNQAGSYAYINAEGKEVRASYVADHNGFRVLSNDLPVAPVFNGVAPIDNGVAPAAVQDTPEVVAAKAEFFKSFSAAAAAAAASPEAQVYADETPAVVAVVPAEYTPEVVAARAEFFKLYAESAAAAAAAPEQRKKRSLFAYSYPAVAKTTFKTAHFEKDDKAMTPAATAKLVVKEQEHEVVTPLAYHTPLTIHAPLAVRSYAPITTTKILTPSPYFNYGYYGY